MSTATTHMDNKPSLQASHCEDEERSKRKQSHPLVPALRFSEFDGDWEKKKLGDVGKIRMCKRIFSSDTTEIGDIPFYKIGTFGKQADAYISNELYLDYRERFSFPKIDDILMSASGTLGRTVIYDGSPSYYQDSNIVWIDNEEEVITNSFLFYIYQIVRYDSEGGTIQRLYNSIINNAKFSKPSLTEQQKIASFLSAVDEKIQQLTKKKALLEDYKKGVMQQLFSGQLRFKDENGKAYPDWEEKLLGEIATFLKGKGISKADLSDEGVLECIRYGELYTVYRETIIEVFSRTNVPEKELVLSEKDDVIIPASGETQIDIATASCVLKANIALGGDLNIIRSANDGVFLAYYLNSALKFDIARLSQGVSVVHLYSSQLKTLKIGVPKIEEQKKIATYLSGIDAKIAAVNNQITQTQTFKKGLLQQMFV
ncbi:MAG: type I restriction enzyme S subunit [Psychroserpens sp.]|jgi:type I restriction enzyme S subunit